MPRHALGGVLAAFIVLPLAGGCESWSVRHYGPPVPAVGYEPAAPVVRASQPQPTTAPTPSADPMVVGTPLTGPGMRPGLGSIVSTPPTSTDVLPPTPSRVPSKGDNIEALMTRLSAIQAQKAELEKAEQETAALLKEKLKQQKQRLKKMGVGVKKKRQTSPPPPPVATSRG